VKGEEKMSEERGRGRAKREKKGKGGEVVGGVR
jgi:hypothetical protein